LLSGQPAIDSGAGGRGVAASSGQEIDELRSRVATLEAEVAALREVVEQLRG
jgi:outer membrane murein-binding lipoprotein Lpp